MDPVRQGLYTLLAADTTLTGLVGDRVYHQRATREAAFPYVIFARSSDRAEWCLDGGDDGRTDHEVWLIKAVDRSLSTTVVEDIDTAIQAAIGDADLTAIPGLLDLRRTVGVDYPEDDAADVYRHRGGMYRVTREHTPTGS